MSAVTGTVQDLEPSLGEVITERLTKLVPVVLRWGAALAVALLIFSVLLVIKGANPIDTFRGIWESTINRPRSLQEIVNRMTPLILGALAVAVPARAGLTNVGGEGQIIIGGVAACGTYLALSSSLPVGLLVVLMLLASMIAGALWAGLAAALRLAAGVNEAISTLLLNFVALDVLLFLIYQPWRADPTGQPTSKEIADAVKLPIVAAGNKIHVGIFIALIAVIGVYLILNKTRWGFKISVAGGNAEAARRSGMNVAVLVVSALTIGGALAGLAGMIQFTGVEYRLNPGFGNQLGYTSFLACWLARHSPFPILAASFVFATLSVAGDSLQLDSGLPAATTSVLTALILIAVLGFTTKRKVARI